MVGPIAMPLRTKRRSFGIKHSARLAPFSHPLDFSREDYWDTDVDSVVASSYNESIISVTSIDSFGGYSLLPLSSCSPTKRPSVTPATVLMPLVATRYSEPTTTSSHSQLLALIRRNDEERNMRKSQEKRDQEISDKESRDQESRSGESKISHIKNQDVDLLQLSLRWRAIRLSIMTLAMIPLSPRSTDDGVPKSHHHLEANGNTNATGGLGGWANGTGGHELVTFASRAPQTADIEVKYSKVRNRGDRINSDFLKCYALDLCARVNGTLPSTKLPGEVEQLVQDPALRSFNDRYGLETVSNASRVKLWDSVILPPRVDAHPLGTIDYSSYAYVGDDEPLCSGSSIVSKNGKCIPWAAHRSSLRPAGVLASGKALSSKSPMGSTTPAQYTIKGWCNRRWASTQFSSI